MSRDAECFGRSSERTLLRDHVRRAIAGDQQLVLIEGEAGIGKTALLLSFAREQARERKARTFYLKAPETEAYQPVHHAALAATSQRLYRRVGGRRQATEVVRSVYLDWVGAIPVVGDIVAAIIATLERIRARRAKGFLPTGASVDENISALLTAARRKPLILLLDDLEKANPAEIARLEKLICVADTDAHILIVGAYRPAAPGEPQPPVSRLLNTLPNADEIFVRRRLGSLSREEIAEWVSGRFPGTDPPEAFMSRLHETTGGHPGAVHEALGDLQFRGGIRRQMGRWHFEADIAMPVLVGGSAPTVDLGALPPEIADTVRAASGLGIEFDGTSLARLLGADELEVEDRLAGAVHFGILENSGEYVLANGDMVTKFRFRSPHIVPLLRETLPAQLRAALDRDQNPAGSS